MAEKVCLAVLITVVLFGNSGAKTLGSSFWQSKYVHTEKPGCTVYVKADLPDQQPLFISKNYKLMVPSYGSLSWEPEETAWMACPGKSTSKAEKIKCSEGTRFKLESGKEIDIRYKTCDGKFLGQKQPTSDSKCVGSSTAIGFNVTFPDKARFVDLFRSCANESNGLVHYTQHILFGNELNHRKEYQSAFRTKDLYADGKYYSRVDGLNKTLLTPSLDQIFNSWQYATYRHVNVAHMWQKSHSIMRNVENAIRNFAIKSGKKLDIFTGTYGRLDYSNEKDPPGIQKLPVPKFVWKIVKDRKEDMAIAFVVWNDPFSKVKTLCKSKDSYGWYHETFVSVCTVQDLRRKVSFIPKDALASEILKHDMW